MKPVPPKLLPLLFLLLALPGCESGYSHADDALSGVMIGAATGAVVGGLCCGDPVHGIPAGILIGGVAGGVGGLLWPVKDKPQTER